MPLPLRLLPTTFLRTLLDALFDEGALLLAPSGRIVEANARALLWAAMTREEVVGQDIGLLFPPAHRQGRRWELHNRHGAPLRLEVKDLPLHRGYRLLRLRPWSEAQAQQQADALREQASHIFCHLLDRLQSPFEGLTIQMALEEIHDLVSAHWLALYAAQESEWRLMAGSGPLPSLPAAIPWEETSLPHLLHCQLWSHRNRRALPDTPLAQVLRSQPYCYTVPLGEGLAPTGLLLAAYTEKPAENLLTPILRVTAHLLHTWQNLHHTFLRTQATENRLKEDAQLGIQLWHLFPKPAFILDHEGLLLAANPSVLHLLGYRDEEIQGLLSEQVIILQERSDLLALIQHAFRQGTAQTLEGVHLIRRSGESFPATLHFIPLSNTRLLLLIQDHTADAENLTLERRALLGTLMASYAHEIRNPLNNLSTGLEYLLLSLEEDPEPEDEEIQDTLRRMQQDIERLEEMSRRLLQFARPANDAHPRRIDLASLLRNLIHRWQPRFQQYGIEVSWQVPHNLPPVCGDAVLLEQAFANLVDNAIQALKKHPHPRQIVLRGEPQEGHLEIIIADNGPGIPEEIQKRIFELFFTTRADGHGLGLALVRKTITDHHGSVSLESYPGQGTLLRVRLPIAQTC